MIAKIPEIGDYRLESLLNKMNAEFEPINVKVSPEKGMKSLDCTENVAQQVKKHGGKAIYGWRIWQSDQLIEAEFHAVWENTKGELMDITPLQLGMKFNHILFLEDDSLVYEGKQIDNIRINITDNKMVDLFIQACHAIFLIKNRGERALLHDEEFEKSLSEEDKDEIMEYAMIQSAIYQFTQMGKSHEDECLCGSLKNVMDCHGAEFTKKLDLILTEG